MFSHYHFHRVYLRYRFLMCFRIKREREKRRTERVMAAKRGEIWKTGHCRRPWLCCSRDIGRLSKKRWYQPGWTNRIRHPCPFVAGACLMTRYCTGGHERYENLFLMETRCGKRYHRVNKLVTILKKGGVEMRFYIGKVLLHWLVQLHFLCRAD